jgi:PKD repeat protein
MKKKITQMLLTIVLSMIVTLSYGSMNKSTSDSCKANFTFTQQPDSAGTKFNFYDASSGNATSWNWYFEDAYTGAYAWSTLKNPVQIFQLQPSSQINVFLDINTSSGCHDSIFRTIIQPAVDTCKADFYYTSAPDSLSSGTRFSFFDASSSNTILWQWSLGNNVYASNKNPVYTYNLPAGTQVNVGLITRTRTGCMDSVYKTIVIPPVSNCKAGFTYTYIPDSLHATLKYAFADSSSSNATSWLWSFGDGTTSTLKNPVHIYNQSGGNWEYVILTIRTSSNCIDTFARAIVLPANTNCKANFIYALQPLDVSPVSTAYKLTDTSTGLGGISYRQWILSDSTHYTDSTFYHKFDSSLTSAKICLDIWTVAGCHSSICKTILLKDTVPVSCKAGFTYTYLPDSSNVGVNGGAKFAFYDSSSSNTNSWYWAFGDGSTSTLKNPVHTYTLQPGSQVTVYHSIRTSTYCEDSIFQTITIPGVPQYIIAGKVKGKNELLSSGIIVLYQKSATGRLVLADANIITNGLFRFNQVKAGKYIIYAIPDVYNASKYLSTYYVDKLHWENADVINLKSNAQGLTLQMASIKLLQPGVCQIGGSVVYTGAVASTSSNQAVLKSAEQISYTVYLFTESGEIINGVTPNASGNFTFGNLPYGTYKLAFEYPNLSNNEKVVSLSLEAPQANNLQFVVDQSALSVRSLDAENNIIVYKVSSDQIAIRISQNGKYMVSLMDITGHTLLNKQMEFEKNTDQLMSIGTVPTGVYILKLENNSTSFIKKIMH